MEAPGPVTHISQIDMMRQMLKIAPSGAFVEVGVYQGGSAYLLAEDARKQGREIHLFDTFAGMPFADEIDNHVVGDFNRTSVAEVKRLIPDAVLHIGVFPDTLSDDLQDIALVHVDCDQYRSTRDAIEQLYPRIVPGGFMVFDDYNCTRGATKAVDEAFGDKIERSAARRAHVRKPL